MNTNTPIGPYHPFVTSLNLNSVADCINCHVHVTSPKKLAYSVSLNDASHLDHNRVAEDLSNKEPVIVASVGAVKYVYVHKSLLDKIRILNNHDENNRELEVVEMFGARVVRATEDFAYIVCPATGECVAAVLEQLKSVYKASWPNPVKVSVKAVSMQG